MSAFEIQLILGLLVAVAALGLLAEKFKLPFPILLVIAGTVIGFLPGLPRSKVAVSPDLVFVAFLPPLLYYGGLMTAWRDFRGNLWPIITLAIGLVLVTIIAIAYSMHWLIPAMPLAAAFVLGAIISPPDAIAAAAVVEHFKVPRRVVTILEGESLVNDVTALVAYGLAINAITSGQFSFPQASLRFVILVVGGIGVGLFAGWLTAMAQKRLDGSYVEGVVALLAPYIAYVPAEWMKVSGVLAAVVSGIYMSRQSPRILSANSRMRLTSLWETFVFLLNGVVFILIGLQLPSIAEALSQIPVWVLFKYGFLISVVTIILRIAWVYALVWLRRKLLRKSQAQWGAVTVVAWAGMRGIVTLAAALALPLTLANKSPFPQRDMIIYLSFCVILVTLIFQGLTLGPLIEWLKLVDDNTAQKEEWEARLDAAHAALARLQMMTLEEEIPDRCLEIVRMKYDQRILQYSVMRKGETPEVNGKDSAILDRLRKEALTAERRMLTMMRDQNIIGDEVLRRVIRDIDLAEARLG